jgi:hypothetical protein
VGCHRTSIEIWKGQGIHKLTTALPAQKQPQNSPKPVQFSNYVLKKLTLRLIYNDFALYLRELPLNGVLSTCFGHDQQPQTSTVVGNTIELQIFLTFLIAVWKVDSSRNQFWRSACLKLRTFGFHSVKASSSVVNWKNNVVSWLVGMETKNKSLYVAFFPLV